MAEEDKKPKETEGPLRKDDDSVIIPRRKESPKFDAKLAELQDEKVEVPEVEPPETVDVAKTVERAAKVLGKGEGNVFTRDLKLSDLKPLYQVPFGWLRAGVTRVSETYQSSRWAMSVYRDAKARNISGGDKAEPITELEGAASLEETARDGGKGVKDEALVIDTPYAGDENDEIRAAVEGQLKKMDAEEANMGPAVELTKFGRAHADQELDWQRGLEPMENRKENRKRESGEKRADLNPDRPKFVPEPDGAPAPPRKPVKPIEKPNTPPAAEEGAKKTERRPLLQVLKDRRAERVNDGKLVGFARLKKNATQILGDVVSSPGKAWKKVTPREGLGIRGRVLSLSLALSSAPGRIGNAAKEALTMKGKSGEELSGGLTFRQGRNRALAFGGLALAGFAVAAFFGSRGDKVSSNKLPPQEPGLREAGDKTGAPPPKAAVNDNFTVPGASVFNALEGTKIFVKDGEITKKAVGENPEQIDAKGLWESIARKAQHGRTAEEKAANAKGAYGDLTKIISDNELAGGTSYIVTRLKAQGDKVFSALQSGKPDQAPASPTK